MGRLHGVTEAGTEPDTVRAELIPGQSEIYRFAVAGGGATAIEAFGSRFERCIDSEGSVSPPPAIP
jgi:hypothetical protein